MARAAPLPQVESDGGDDGDGSEVGTPLLLEEACSMELPSRHLQDAVHAGLRAVCHDGAVSVATRWDGMLLGVSGGDERQQSWMGQWRCSMVPGVAIQ